MAQNQKALVTDLITRAHHTAISVKEVRSVHPAKSALP